MTDRKTWHRLAPGVYDDDAGVLHLDLPEMLAANGWPNTAENRATLEQAAREVFKTAGVIVVDEAD